MVIYPSTLSVRDIEKLVKFDITNNLLKGYTSSKTDNVFGSIVHEALVRFVDEKNVLDEEAAAAWSVPLIKSLDKNYMDRLKFILCSYNRNKTIKSQDIENIFKEEMIEAKAGSNVVRGRIDKIITTKQNYLYIIDYKTTLTMKPINSFRGQAKCYQYLLERAGFTGYKKVYFCIHYLDFNFIDIAKLKMDTEKIEYILMNMKA